MNMVDASTLSQPSQANPIAAGGDKPADPTPLLNPNQDPNEASSRLPVHFRSLEQRKQAASMRVKTAASYRGLFQDAAQRIIDREKTNVSRAAKKYMASRSADDFKGWLNDYYRDFQDYIQRQIKPVAQSLANAIHPLASEEVNTKNEHLQPVVDKFVNQYAADFAKRYSSSSQGQLNEVVTKSAGNKDGDPVGDVLERLDEWDDKRSDKVAANETVQLSNGVARMTFVAAGIASLVWAKTGSEKCSICDQLDGKTVGSQENFLTAGDSLSLPDNQHMNVYRDTAHPPAHETCDCTIMPG
jgi:hypothetical protein